MFQVPTFHFEHSELHRLEYASVFGFYLTNREAGHVLICSLYDLQHHFYSLVVVWAELYERKRFTDQLNRFL